MSNRTWGYTRIILPPKNLAWIIKSVNSGKISRVTAKNILKEIHEKGLELLLETQEFYFENKEYVDAIVKSEV